MSRRRPLARLDRSLFSPRGIHLDLRDPQCCAWGNVWFGPPSPIRYDIMGPFAWVPFLECRHRIFSMRHRVTGRLVINDTEYRFADAAGVYRGRPGLFLPPALRLDSVLFLPGFPDDLRCGDSLGPVRFTGPLRWSIWGRRSTIWPPTWVRQRGLGTGRSPCAKAAWN